MVASSSQLWRLLWASHRWRHHHSYGCIFVVASVPFFQSSAMMTWKFLSYVYKGTQKLSQLYQGLVQVRKWIPDSYHEIHSWRKSAAGPCHSFCSPQGLCNSSRYALCNNRNFHDSKGLVKRLTLHPQSSFLGTSHLIFISGFDLVDFLNTFCVARSVSVSKIPFFASFGWDLHQRRRLHHPGEWCDRWYHSLHGGVNRIFRWSQVWLFFCEKVELICSLLSWGLDILGRIKGDFFKDFGYKSVFCFTAWLCLSTILPEAGRIGPKKIFKSFHYQNWNVDAVSTTDFQTWNHYF